MPADPAFGIICLKLTTVQVDEIPDWLRRLLRLPEFKTKRARLGKVVLASRRSIQYYTTNQKLIHFLPWPS